MAVVVDQSRLGGNSRSTLGTITDINPLIRLLFSRLGQPYLGPAWISPSMTLMGCVPLAKGLAYRRLDLEKALDLEKSLNEGRSCFLATKSALAAEVFSPYGLF